MSNSQISEWLQTQSGLLHPVLAGVVRLAVKDSEAASLVGYPEHSTALGSLNSVAELAISQGKPVIQAPGVSATQANPTLTIACPVSLHNGVSGAVAFLLKGRTPQQGKQAIAMLRLGLPWLSKLLDNDCAESASLQDKLGKLTRLVATGLAAEQFNSVATTLTTELATELNCDRVFLGMTRSRKIRLEGISKTSELARRDAFAQAITASMDEASDQGCSIAAPTVQQAASRLTLSIRHDDLIKRYTLGAVCTVPLMLDQEVVGALLFERDAQRIFRPEDLVLFEQVAHFLTPILKMKYRIGKPLLSRMRDRASRWKRWLLSRNGMLWKLFFVALITVVIGLGTVPVAYEVTTASRLEGSVQRTLSAPENGFIQTVNVRPGDSIKKGQVLIQLDDRDLLLQQQKAKNEIRQLESRFGQALATSDRTELGIIQAGIAEAEAGLALIEQQLTRLSLSSPLDGIVLEGDLTQSLGAPVALGDKLMTLTPSLDFRIILDIQETDIKNVNLGQTGRIAFSAEPSKHYRIAVRRISPMAILKEGNNVFEVGAQFDEPVSPLLRPGFEGLAQLYVDDRSLIRIGYEKIRSWVDMKLWRWTGLA